VQTTQLSVNFKKVETASLHVTDGTVVSSPDLSVTVSPGVAATFTVGGAATAIAGTAQSITLTAKDANGNTVGSGTNNYTGDKTLTFSGPSNGPSGGSATVTSKTGVATNVGTGELVTFVNGVADQSVQTTQLNVNFKKVETASLHVTDGTVTSSPDLSVTVSPGAATTFAVGGSSTATAGTAQFITLTAKDANGN